MNTSIVLTIIADDKPGIVQTVSETLKNHGGDWTQSSMSTLAGQFAGILLASVPTKNSEACLEELNGLKNKGLGIVVHLCSESSVPERSHVFALELLGNNRPGIVHEVTTVLVKHKVSIHSLKTSVESASMAGGELFRAHAELAVPESTDIETLESELEDLANELMVDIHFVK